MKNRDKFELVKDQSIVYKGRRLYRIRALTDFGFVSKGEIGGYVEKTTNMSSFVGDSCWLYKNSKVYGDGYITDNVILTDQAEVFDHAIANGDCEISGNAKIYGNAMIRQEAEIKDNAEVFGNAVVSGISRVSGNVKIYEHAELHDDVDVSGKVEIKGNTLLSGSHIYINDSAVLTGDVKIPDDCIISGKSLIDGSLNEIMLIQDSRIHNATLRCNAHHMVFHLNLPGARHELTWTFSNDRWAVRTDGGIHVYNLTKNEVAEMLSVLNRELFLNHYCKIVDEIKNNIDWKGNYSVKH